MGFIAHTIFADKTAAYIGWPAGNPFQYEVAVANLSYGILGILCIWLKDKFWIATFIGFSVLYFGAAYGHIVQILTHHNYSPGNAGSPLIYDIAAPLIGFALLILYSKVKQGSS